MILKGRLRAGSPLIDPWVSAVAKNSLHCHQDTVDNMVATCLLTWLAASASRLFLTPADF